MRDDDNERRCCSLFVALCQICVPLSKPVVQEDWISRAFGDVDGSPREEKQIGQSDRLALNLKFLLRWWSCFYGEKKWSPCLMFPACSNCATQPHTTPHNHITPHNQPKVALERSILVAAVACGLFEVSFRGRRSGANLSRFIRLEVPSVWSVMTQRVVTFKPLCSRRRADTETLSTQ